jgi:hypothetical protein
MTSNILIQSFIGDLHAEAVSWGLTKRDVKHRIWHQSFFPSEQFITARLNNTRGVFDTCVSPYFEYEGFTLNDISVFWNRRRAKLSHLAELHEADRQFADDECKRYLFGVRDTLSNSAFLINDPRLAERANSKLFQLAEAVNSGFFIPDTLATNNAEELRCFYDEHRGEIIIKPFQANAWLNEATNTAFFSYTNKVTPGLLENELSIQSSPCLYQKMIQKKYEVRVLWMGQSYLAVKINSQSHEKTKNDWRIDQNNIEYTRISLPLEIESKCRNYMKKLGLATGSFDFMVDMDGDYVFLEINEAGQFLFYEHSQPEIPALDAFVSFLEHGGPCFEYKESSGSMVTLLDFLSSPAYEAFTEKMKNEKYIRQVSLPCKE